MTDNDNHKHRSPVSDAVKAMLDERERLMETIAQVAEALGWNVGRVQLGDGDIEYHLPCAADMVEAIKCMPFKSIKCHAIPGTKDCLVSIAPRDIHQSDWRTVGQEWWCSNCLERYGFVIDEEQPGDDEK